MARAMSTQNSRGESEKPQNRHLAESLWTAMARSVLEAESPDTLMIFSDGSSLRTYVEDGHYGQPRAVLEFSTPLFAAGFDGADLTERFLMLLSEIPSLNGSDDPNAFNSYMI
jgi:hypothetical protein